MLKGWKLRVLSGREPSWKRNNSPENAALIRTFLSKVDKLEKKKIAEGILNIYFRFADLSCCILSAAVKPESYYCLRTGNWRLRRTHARAQIGHGWSVFAASHPTWACIRRLANRLFPPTKHLVGSEVVCGCVKFAFDQRQACLTFATDIVGSSFYL